MGLKLVSRTRIVWVVGAMALMATAFTPAAVARAPLLDEQRGVLTLAPVLEIATPAVVSISVETGMPGADNPLFKDAFFRRFFGLPDALPERRAMSAGSGVIVDSDKGHILTNHAIVPRWSRSWGRRSRRQRISLVALLASLTTW